MIRIFDFVGEYWPVMVRGAAPEGDSQELPEPAEPELDDAQLAIELGVHVQAPAVENPPDSQIPPDSFSETQIIRDDAKPPEEPQTLEYIPDTLLDPETLPEEENPPDRLRLPEEESLPETMHEDTPPEETKPQDAPPHEETGEKGGEVESNQGSDEKAKEQEMDLAAVQARIKQLKWLGSCQSILLDC